MAVTLLATTCPSWAQRQSTANVLVIHSNQRATPAQVIIEDALRTAIAGGIADPGQVFSEYLDNEWTATEAFAARQAAFLQERYQDRSIRVVVVDALPALLFLRKYRDRLAPGIPIVYLAVAPDRVPPLGLAPDFIGVLEDNDPVPTLRLALRMHPGASRLVMIAGGSTFGRLWEQRMRDAVARLGSAIEVQWLAGLPHAEVLRAVRTLPSDAVVFTPGYFNDGAGIVFTPRDSIQQIAAAATAPVYGTFPTQLGTGIVGGYMTRYEEEAREAGAAVVRLLNGTPPEAIPSLVTQRQPMLDARALRRWNVDPRRLPADAAIEFREPSLLETYKTEISLGIAALILQAVLIAALLIQRRQRRMAEHASFALAGRLLTAHEDERRRLARDLHDDVTQRLARLAIDAAGLERDAPGVPGKVAARGVREDLVRLSEDVHGLSYQLHPSVLDDLGLAEGIRAECARVERQDAIAVDVDVDAVTGKLPREPTLCLFRIAQEALRNVVRHAHAHTVGVRLVPDGGGIRLTVRDDGRGFDAAQGNAMASLGRISMRERARQAGGSLRIESAPGHGTTVTAWAPLRASP